MLQLIAYPLTREDGSRLKEHSIIIFYQYQNLIEMKARDLIRLPLGKYELTDGIYYYTVTKKIADHNKEVVYLIREKQSWSHFSLFEDQGSVHENSSKYQRIILSALITIGGFYIHSNNLYYQLRKLSLVPKTSYKQWLELMETEFVRNYNTEKV